MSFPGASPNPALNLRRHIDEVTLDDLSTSASASTAAALAMAQQQQLLGSSGSSFASSPSVGPGIATAAAAGANSSSSSRSRTARVNTATANTATTTATATSSSSGSSSATTGGTTTPTSWNSTLFDSVRSLIRQLSTVEGVARQATAENHWLNAEVVRLKQALRTSEAQRGKLKGEVDRYSVEVASLRTEAIALRETHFAQMAQFSQITQAQSNMSAGEVLSSPQSHVARGWLQSNLELKDRHITHLNELLTEQERLYQSIKAQGDIDRARLIEFQDLLQKAELDAAQAKELANRASAKAAGVVQAEAERDLIAKLLWKLLTNSRSERAHAPSAKIEAFLNSRASLVDTPLQLLPRGQTPATATSASSPRSSTTLISPITPGSGGSNHFSPDAATATPKKQLQFTTTDHRLLQELSKEVQKFVSAIVAGNGEDESEDEEGGLGCSSNSGEEEDL